MPKASPPITSFNGGYVSALASGRTDLENYPSSCSVIENMVPTIQGPAVKRPGTIFVAEEKTMAKKVRLIPFEFSIEQAYVCEFGENYIRFYTNGAQLISGTPVEVATTYLESELFELQVAQTADIMYITHPNHPPAKLSRTSPTAFSLDTVVFEWPPFLDENVETGDTVTVTGLLTAGSAVTITASSSIFDATHTTSYFRIDSVAEAIANEWKPGVGFGVASYCVYEGNVYYTAAGGTTGTRPPVHELGTESDGTVGWEFHNDGAGYIDITGYTSPTIVTGTVVKNLPPAVTNTFRYSFSAWSDFEGYPRSVAFYESRLIMGGTAKKPQTLWGSVTDQYENYKDGTEDDDAFIYTINTNQVNTIQWLSPSRVLAIGTAGGEFIATGKTFNDAITPTGVRITRQTTFGSAYIRPAQIGADVLFVQRSKRSVREYRFNYEIEAYVATDLNIFADDVLSGSVTQLDYQQEPSRILWYATGAGELIGLTFERQQSVVGWHTHVFGGADVEVESIAVIPHPDGDVDQLWLSIKRTVNGGTVRYVERMEKLFSGEETPEAAVFSDSAVIYSGAATTTITGLDHLEGETVTILCDGAVLKPDQVVASGQITLPRACTDVVAGLAYEARLQTLPIEAGAADGTAQGKTGRVNNLSLRVKGTGPGIFYGSDFNNMAEIHLRTTVHAMDEPVPLYTGVLGPEIMPSGYEKPNAIAIKHNLPLPFTLSAIYPQLHKQDR